jgi:hypothetical protein
MTEVQRMLVEEWPWIRERCRRQARKIRHPSFRGEELADELLGRTAHKFLESVERGWFDQAAYRSRKAQARNALAFALRQAQTDLFRDADKPGTANDGDDVGSDELPRDRIPEETTDGSEPLERIIREQRVAHVLEAIRNLNPGHRLYLLATYFPDRVVRQHVVEAAGFGSGGARVVVRDPEKTWECFRALRSRGEHQDEARWKKLVAELFRLETPMGEASAAAVKGAVSAYDQRLTHARRTVADWLKEHHLLDRSSPMGRPTGIPTFSLGDLADRHRRNSPASASRTEEGAVLPDGAAR